MTEYKVKFEITISKSENFVCENAESQQQTALSKRLTLFPKVATTFIGSLAVCRVPSARSQLPAARSQKHLANSLI
jgi:hypothetical protein